MRARLFIVLAFVISCNSLFGQASYSDSLQTYLDGYVKDHEVVKGDDKKFFQFFPADESYRVIADFEKAKDSKWFLMATSGNQKKMYRVYGTLSFSIHDTLEKLDLYQAQDLLSDP